MFALENANMRGVFNAVSPNPARNIDLVKATATAMGVHALPIPAPAFALRLMLGEMADVVLNSNRVASDKLVAAGFSFAFPELDVALRQIFA
jgi:NAD dependent epimerase/dehydratase family enzyme